MDADIGRFEEEDAQVLGISVDGTATNAAWAESLGVSQISLLSDFWPHGEVAQAFGVLREQGVTERATFIVDKDGVVRFKRIYGLNELPDNEVLFDALRQIND